MDEQQQGGTRQPEGVSPQPRTPPEIDYPAMTDPRLARSPRRGLPRWLKISGATAALLLVAGTGVVVGANTLSAQAANGGLASKLGLLNGAPSAGWTGQHHGPGGPRHGGELTVSSVSGQTITTKNASGATVAVKVSSSTQYARLGKSVSLSAITAGETIHVMGARNSDGSISATRVDIEIPSYGGQVTAISGSTITITDRQGTSRTIHTSASTTVERADATSSLSAIAKGDQIVASGAKNSDGSLNAEQISVRLPHAGGQIQSLSSSAITVKDSRGNTATIHLSASTRYVTISQGTNGPTQTATTFSALKSGAYISAEGAKNSDGSVNAEVVTILPGAPFGGPHGGFGGGPNGDNDGDGPHGTAPASNDTSTNSN